MTRSTALLLTGTGAYADEWHDLPATSGRVAALLEGAGFAVEVDGAVEARMADPGPVDLVVADFGAPRGDGVDAAGQRRALAGLEEHVAAGRGLLALHASLTSMTAVGPGWSRLLGGRWIAGRSMHPPFGPARVEVLPVPHPVTRGSTDFTTPDERYTDLVMEPGSQVLAVHRHEGAAHPLVWTADGDGGRAVAIALGHAPESWDGAAGRVLVRAAEWAVGGHRSPSAHS